MLGVNIFLEVNNQKIESETFHRCHYYVYVLHAKLFQQLQGRILQYVREQSQMHKLRWDLGRSSGPFKNR